MGSYPEPENQVYTFTNSSFKIQFDFMLHWTPGPSNGPFLSRFYATLDAWTFKRAFSVQILCYIGRLDLQTGLLCPDFMLHWTSGPSNGPFLSRFYATLDAWTFKRVFSVQILCYIGRLDLQTGLFCPDFPPKTLHALLTHSMRAACSAHVIQINLTTIMIYLVSSDYC